MATDDMRFCNTEVCPIIECEFLQVVLTQYRVDFHAGFWQACTVLYNSTVNIYNHESGAIVITFEVTEVLVRRVKFIARSKNWFVAGSDDFEPRVFNNVQYSITTLVFEAHLDCIRFLTVSPTTSFVLTGSDDMSIKAWDWDKTWKNIQVSARTIMSLFLIHITNRHTKAIRVISLNLAFKSKYAHTFLSACLDSTINMWTLGLSNFSMQEHEKGVELPQATPRVSEKSYQ